MVPRSDDQNKQIRDERREQILNAALLVFARKGLSGTKISDIISAANLSHGLLYHYFNSKDEVFAALVERALELSGGAVSYAVQMEGSPMERLRWLTHAMLDNYSKDKISAYYFLVMLQASTFEDVPKDVKELIEKQSPKVMELTIPLIIEGQRLGEFSNDDPVVLAATYWCLMQGIVLSYMESEGSFPLPQADIVLRLLKA